MTVPPPYNTPSGRKEADPGHRMTDVWIFVVTDQDGDESVPAVRTRSGIPLPMIATDAARVELLRPTAVEIAREYKSLVQLIRFTGPREIIATWLPHPPETPA